jgi:hypothetical protein
MARNRASFIDASCHTEAFLCGNSVGCKKEAMNVTIPPSRGAVALVAGALTISFLVSAPASPSTTNSSGQSRHLFARATSSGSDWLGEINQYRSASGLAPVTDQQSWDAGIVDHLIYLEKTPAKYFTGAYVSEHTENPASPYYTAAGAREGDSSDLFPDVGAESDVHIIDGWLTAPFHAVGMLRATLGQVAFADHGGDAALDVISGLNQNPPATGPILFPGPNMTTDLTTYGDELPSPLQTCKWTGTPPVGLPLIALLTQAPSSGLTAGLVSSSGSSETSQKGTLCVVDAADYFTTNTVYGPTGLEILQSDNAVFLIPKSPLTQGTYTATISQPGASVITWAFHVATPPTIATEQLPESRIDVAFHRVLVAKGGERPYRWSISSGKLPPGLRLTSAGTLAGTPRRAGSFLVQVVATDALGHESEPQYLELRVNSG